MLVDGTGRIALALQAVFTALTTQEHARSAGIWLIVNPDVTKLLRTLATGTAPLEHDTFTHHPKPKKVEFLRDLLVEHRVLPPYDGDIERFTSWLEQKVSTATPEQSTLTRQHSRWVHLNRMHHLTEIGALKPGTMLATFNLLDPLKQRRQRPPSRTGSMLAHTLAVSTPEETRSLDARGTHYRA